MKTALGVIGVLVIVALGYCFIGKLDSFLENSFQTDDRETDAGKP